MVESEKSIQDQTGFKMTTNRIMRSKPAWATWTLVSQKKTKQGGKKSVDFFILWFNWPVDQTAAVEPSKISVSNDS